MSKKMKISESSTTQCSDSNQSDSSSSCDSSTNECSDSNQSDLSSSQCSDSSSCSEIECSLASEIPKDDFAFLLTRSKFFSDPDLLVFTDKVFILSNDIVLYYVLLLDYSKILSLVDKKIKKHINALTTSKDIILIYTDKLCNIDPKEVVSALSRLSLTDTSYIFISKCYYPTKEEKEEFKEVFPDFEEEVIPVRVEEIFLNEVSKIKKNFQVAGNPYQMYLLSKEEVEKYINILMKESAQ